MSRELFAANAKLSQLRAVEHGGARIIVDSDYDAAQ